MKYFTALLLNFLLFSLPALAGGGGQELPEDWMKEYMPYLFPVFFVLMWLFVTTLLGRISGWHSLMEKYPDRDEQPLLQLKGQSGSMGPGVNMRNILRIAVCPSGLRLGMMKIFGPFHKDFFVPWEDIRVTRKTSYIFFKMSELQFGNPSEGKLVIRDYIADQLARAAPGKWPEAGAFPPETGGKVFAGVFKEWAISTLLASAFFIVAPRIMSPSNPGFPISIAIAFPAVVFGVGAIFSYFKRAGAR
jgi:hypothetical protein